MRPSTLLVPRVCRSMEAAERVPKRCCQPANDALLRSESPSAHAAACLLPLLQPVRHCLHPFVSSRDAARLRQTSRSITACLLSGYVFLDHVFFDCFPATADVKRSLAFYAHYDMRITRMGLPEEWNEPLVDSESGRSVLPASLIALTLG